jgi:TnpA family transposase
MALAKLVGFDLCPRLAKLKKRKLYLPRGLDIPEMLRPCVAETVSRRAISRGWEELLRRRLGEARLVPGDRGARPVRFGRCWRSRLRSWRRSGEAPAHPLSLRLLRQSGIPDRNPHLLNQGEAVHSLQRAVYNGVIPAKHGRTMEELGAISGALTLLTKIVMAWNTHRLQLATDRTRVSIRTRC